MRGSVRGAPGERRSYRDHVHRESIYMPTKMKLAFFCYSFNVIGLFLFGLIYTFSGEFLPFHSDAIQKPWESLSQPTQVLYLGMMRTEGAGFLSSALAIGILLFIPFKKCEIWSYWAMSAIGIVEHVPGLIGAYNTSQATPASSPWQLSLLGIVLLLAGLILSLNSKIKIVNSTKVATGL